MEISSRIIHIDTELGTQGYARLVFLVDGVEFCHENFGCDSPTNREVSEKRQSLAYSLYYNDKFAKYHKNLYRMAYPYGE